MNIYYLKTRNEFSIVVKPIIFTQVKSSFVNYCTFILISTLYVEKKHTTVFSNTSGYRTMITEYNTRILCNLYSLLQDVSVLEPTKKKIQKSRKTVSFLRQLNTGAALNTTILDWKVILCYWNLKVRWVWKCYKPLIVVYWNIVLWPINVWAESKMKTRINCTRRKPKTTNTETYSPIIELFQFHWPFLLKNYFYSWKNIMWGHLRVRFIIYKFVDPWKNV